jgi:hypothetical protein
MWGVCFFGIWGGRWTGGGITILRVVVCLVTSCHKTLKDYKKLVDFFVKRSSETELCGGFD